MKGFKDFIMQGPLVELAVAVVIATAFGEVVKAMVDVIMDLIGKAGGTPNFSAWEPGDVSVGLLLTALISFIILAAVVYFFVVKPYVAAKAKYLPEEAAEVDANTELLKEIRDSLRARP